MSLIKKTKGRQKIDMKFIHDNSARRITFTKRRSGLFKKATELSALCGTEIAIVILSGERRGKAYSFGHPCVGSVVSRFANGNNVEAGDRSWINGSVDSDGCEKLQKLTEQCDKMNKEIEIEKRRAKELDAALGNSTPTGRISGKYLNRLDLTQLLYLKEVLEKLRDDVRRESGSAPAPAPPGDLDLAKVEEGNGYDADGAPEPIPCDWLKL